MKEFKISEEQIKENKDLTLKEYFKEVFETKLEVGKWYKYSSGAMFFVENEIKSMGKIGFGFIGDGKMTYTDNFYYYQFKRNNSGSLLIIGKFNDKYDLQFNNGCVWYSEEEIESVKDNFLVANQRIVKNGKTWLKNYINKKSPSYFY